ncbi:tetratricopeptide repeat protein [candidate division KSB1 bacterium]|nr:tetratricopeptide repeat protein [candidate division KSB1 bacterium]
MKQRYIPYCNALIKSMCYDSLGCLAADQGNLPEALTLYHRALAVREEIGEKLGIIGTLFHLGTTHLELGQLDEATTHLERATQLCQAHQIGSAQMMGVVYLSLVQLARSPQQTADILQQLNWAWEMLQTNELEAEHVPPLYFDLYKAFLQLNDPKARAALQKAHDALTTQAAKIQDTTMKERFLQVPLHKRIVDRSRPKQTHRLVFLEAGRRRTLAG